MTSLERGVFQASETKLIRDVTPQEIAERTGGSRGFAFTEGTKFIGVIEYEHTEGLLIWTERPRYGAARERLSILILPEPSMTLSLDDDATTIILRPDSVTFGIPIRGEKSLSPSQLVEVTITRKGFSYSTLSA